MAAPTDRLLGIAPEHIPAQLRQLKRWAPWRAEWNEKRGKWGKIPCQTNGYGLSTGKPDRWLSFDAALAALQARPDLFAGLGYCMTGPHGLVGIDLDRCVGADGAVAPWAAEVVEQLGAVYVEISPTGAGLHVLAQGAVECDWTNHEQGIEVYAGHQARFLTVTGHLLPGSAADALPLAPEVLARLSARYARERIQASAAGAPMPDILDELLLPDLAELDLPYQARDFLAEGKHRGDRSRELFATAVALYGAGLRDDEVFSLLAHSPHAMEVALDHRRQDTDRALMYLWVEHAQKARGRATSKVATAEDFEDVSGAGPSAAPPKRERFAFEQAAEFAARSSNLRWLIKGLLPLADLGAVYGAPGAGKSFLVLDLVMHVARGLPWRGKFTRRAAVAYVCAEGAGGFRLRLQAYAGHNGVALDELPLHLLGEAPNLMEKTDVRDLVAALRRIVDLQLIVVDTLAQVTPGANENSAEDMGRALGNCRALGKATGAMVLLVAHAGKDSERGLRGWSGIRGALDVEIEVEREGHHRAATVTKLKDGVGEGDEFAFSLVDVLLGQDEQGEPITSCVVAGTAGLPRTRRVAPEPKGSTQRLVLRLAREMAEMEGTTTPNALIEAAIRQLPEPDAGKRDQRRRHVVVALEALIAANALSVAGGVVRLNGQENADTANVSGSAD